MIVKLIASSRTTEIYTVSMKTSGAFAKTTLNTDPDLLGMNTQLVVITEKLERAIKRSKAKSVLEGKDEVRDAIVRNLYYLLFGLLHHPDPEIRAAAGVVMEQFEKYGLAVVNESYEVETAHISSMLKDFAKPKVEAAIALLTGIAELVSQLDAAETDFEQTSITFDEEKARDGAVENATSIKKEVSDLINNQLLVYLNGMNLVKPDVYGEFALTVSQIIEENNMGVRKRRNNSSNSDED